MKAAAQTFDEATSAELRRASAHARLSSAEGVAVVVDVATVDVETARAWVQAVRAAHAAAAVVLIANKWGLARKEAEEADLVSRAARLARALDVDARFPGLGDVDAEKATDADLAPLRYLLDSVLRGGARLRRERGARAQVRAGPRAARGGRAWRPNKVLSVQFVRDSRCIVELLRLRLVTPQGSPTPPAPPGPHPSGWTRTQGLRLLASVLQTLARLLLLFFCFFDVLVCMRMLAT